MKWRTRAGAIPAGPGTEVTMAKIISNVIESVKPFKVRASCGHIEIRKMREATAGVPYTPETILDAPNGRPCEPCELQSEVDRVARCHTQTTMRQPLFQVGDRVIDRDGFKGSIRRVCRNGEDSLWYEVSFGRTGEAVRYDSDLTLESIKGPL